MIIAFVKVYKAIFYIFFFCIGIYTKERIINSHDVRNRKAQPGEYIQGQFVDGEITIGKHFDASGNLIQALNFGVAE